MQRQPSPTRLRNCAPCSPTIGGQRCTIRNIVPSCTICAALARGGARLRVCAKRERRVGFASWPPGESFAADSVCCCPGTKVLAKAFRKQLTMRDEKEQHRRVLWTGT